MTSTRPYPHIPQVFRNKFISRRQLPPTFLYDRYLTSAYFVYACVEIDRRPHRFTLYNEHTTTEIYAAWVELKLEISTWCWAFIVGVFVIHVLITMASSGLAHFLLHPATFGKREDE